MANKTKADLGILTGREKALTDEVRDNILMLVEKGVDKEFIAKTYGVGLSTIRAIITVNNAIMEDRFADASIYGDALIQWALKRTGKEFPKEAAKKEEQVEAQKEDQKEDQKEELSIDFGRIMYALGKIDERLETITLSLDNIGKWLTQFYEDFHGYRDDANVNADNIYRNITDTKGAITQAIKRITKTYKGVD